MSAQEHAPVVYVLDTVEKLKAVADTLRLRILLETAETPRTVKEIAKTLGVPQTRLYYHFKLLSELGLLRVAARRMVSGIEERSYQATATNWNVSADLLASIGKVGVLSTMFELVSSELDLALQQEGPPPGEPGSAVAAIAYTSFWLDDEQAAEVRKRLEDVMIDFGGPPEPGKTEYRGLLACYQRVDGSS